MKSDVDLSDFSSAVPDESSSEVSDVDSDGGQSSARHRQTSRRDSSLDSSSRSGKRKKRITTPVQITPAFTKSTPGPKGRLPRVLYSLLMQQPPCPLLAWQGDTDFVISEYDRLAHEVFNYDRAHTLANELNSFQFRLKRTVDGLRVYTHRQNLFVKDRPDLVEQIRRVQRKRQRSVERERKHSISEYSEDVVSAPRTRRQARALESQVSPLERTPGTPSPPADTRSKALPSMSLRSPQGKSAADSFSPVRDAGPLDEDTAALLLSLKHNIKSANASPSTSRRASIISAPSTPVQTPRQSFASVDSVAMQEAASLFTKRSLESLAVNFNPQHRSLSIYPSMLASASPSAAQFSTLQLQLLSSAPSTPRGSYSGSSYQDCALCAMGACSFLINKASGHQSLQQNFPSPYGFSSPRYGGLDTYHLGSYGSYGAPLTPTSGRGPQDQIPK